MIMLSGLWFTLAPSASAQVATLPDGAAGYNVNYEEGTLPYWYIEEQRYASEYVERGIAQENPALINEGLLIFNWGFAREASDGSFPGSGDGTPGEVEHSASLFLEAAARSTIELSHYHPVTYTLAPSTYAATIAQYTQYIHLTALWLTGATDPTIPQLLQTYDEPYTHRRYLLGAALQETAVLTGDTTLTPIAQSYIDDGLPLQLGQGWLGALIKSSNGTYPPATLVPPGDALPTGTSYTISAFGVNPEADGYDVNYQAVGGNYAEYWYEYAGDDPTRRAEVKAMLQNALEWEAGEVQVSGVITTTGSSRVGVELDLNGQVKQLSPTVVRDALVDAQPVLNDPIVAVAGNRVNQYGLTVSSTAVSADGAAGANISYDEGKTTTWNIGTQRFATDWINAGIACENPSYIQTGLNELNWGWEQQLSDGSFGTTSSSRFATTQFVEAAARTVIALQNYDPVTYAGVISSYTPKIALSAQWLANDPFHVMASVENYFSHCLGVAAAFAETAEITGNTSLDADAIPYVQQGLSLQLASGENQEDGAADVDWQGIGLQYAELYLPYCTSPTLSSQIVSNIYNGLNWEMQYIDVNGDYEGVTATQPIYYAFAGGAGICRNRAFQVVANRIDNLTVTSLTSPTTLSNLSGTPGTNTWFTSSPVTVTLTASDPASRIAATYYTIDGGSQQTYTAPFTVSGDGTHTITYWSVDLAGNAETPNSEMILIDSVPPSTTASVSGTQTSNGVYIGSATFTLTASDATSGVGGIYYTIDGGAQQTYSSPVTITTGYQHTVQYWAVDVAGNVEASQTLSLAVDAGTPATSASIAGTAGTNGWYTSNVTVTLSMTDPNGSGDVAATYYTVDGGAQQTYSTPFPVSGDGTHTITFWSVDNAGQTEPTNTQTIDIDTTPPVTIASVNGTQVSLTATDATSGVASRCYTIDGGPTQTLNSGTVTVSGVGSHVVTYWAVDVAGNVETPQSITVWIYSQPTIASISPTDVRVNAPPFTLTITGTGFTPASTVKVNANVFTPSYVSPTELTLTVPTSSVASAGQVSIKVGNPAPGGSLSPAVYLNVDGGTPTTTASLSGTTGSNGWFVASPVTVTLSATDTDGPNDPVAATYYTIDGGAQQTYGGPFTLSGDAVHTITYWSVDAVGNVENTNTQTISIDSAPPSTTASVAGSQASSGAYNGSATITLTATDATSGVAATYYTIDGGAQQTYKAPIVLAIGYADTVQYWSVDAAGNVESAHTMSLDVDTVTPSTTPSVSGTAGLNGWYTSNVTVSLTATDAGGPGVAATYYTIDGGAQQTYTAPFAVSGDAAHTITFWSVDTVGNTESVHSQSIDIDTTPPSTTASVNGTQVSLTATDATSGVTYRYYTLDGGPQENLKSGTVTVSAVGANVLTYWSVDVAGNVEATHSITVWIYSVPTVSTISPSTVYAGGPAFTMTINGTGFTPASTVKVNSTILTPTYVSPTELTVSIPTSLYASAGSVSVKVDNPSPGGSLSNAATLTVLAVAVSTVSLSPSTIASGGTSTGTVTLNGPAPVGGQVVAISTGASKAVLSTTSLTIPQGSTSGTFTVSALTVTSNYSAVISAKVGNNTSTTATLTITP